MKWRVSRFTARESRRDREAILRSFRFGDIDGLVAIKCLDEGIDVPACSTAYILASSRDPRQFIQRRGRILRRSPGKTIANIHDFVVVLPEGAHDETGAAHKLISAELKRVAEFSQLAENAYCRGRPGRVRPWAAHGSFKRLDFTVTMKPSRFGLRYLWQVMQSLAAEP